jgi:23S rRNA (adenine2503-C2)-methyltransferase
MSVSEAVLDPAVKAPLVVRPELAGTKPSLIGLTREQMADALKDNGVPEKQVRMRVSQLWHWLYIRGVSDFDAMTNVAKDMRQMLQEHFTIARPEVVEEQVSNDGTRKWLLRFPPRGAGRPSRSRPSISPRKTAARSASPARSVARSPVRSATPARRSWCATSPRSEILGADADGARRLGDFPDRRAPQ